VSVCLLIISGGLSHSACTGYKPDFNG